MVEALVSEPSAEISLRLWSENEFANAAGEWECLLRASRADPLFMSWNWQHGWWSQFGDSLGSTLQIQAAYSSTGQLVGLAPLHSRRVRHRVPMYTRRLESLGSSWRQNSTVFSEYLDFIVLPEYEQPFLAALAQRLLADREWHEFIVANSPVAGVAARFARDYLAPACYVRSVDLLTAQRTALPGEFGQFLPKLHSGTRRKLWNHRKRLREPRVELCAASGIDAFLDELDDLHERRWGKRHFQGCRRTFHRKYAEAMARSGALRMSRLAVAQGTISLMYNVRLGDTEYNIQSGFNNVAAAGVSPGYLHFGYCLEQACRDGLAHFDFLAGDGRSRDYKRDFNTQKVELSTVHAVRSPPLAWLYRQHDRWRALSRRK